MTTEFVTIHTPFIKLEALLKLSGIAVTGGQAKLLIADSKIEVNGAICTERGRKIRPGDRVDCSGVRYEVIS